MKLIDIDQTIFVPIVDESKGGVTYEMQMTVEQFFRRFINEVPPIIDAIPVEWLMDLANRGDFVYGAVARWKHGQEAR